jgi:2-oxoisovalerate dehydrogenase E1 component
MPRAFHTSVDSDVAVLTLPGIDRDEHGKPRIPLEPAALYAYGHLIRSTEEQLLDLFSKGLLSGTTHTCIGQELCQMAVVRALDRPDDVVLSNHRNHGHFLTYSGDFLGLLTEIMGRECGVCRGIGGSQHLAYRHFHSNGVQAGMTAIGAGLALARRTRRSDGIVCCFIGDGTLGEGLLYESLNLASIWRVPMLFVVEHNGIAQTTNTADTIGGSIVARGAAFGLTTWTLDDADPEVCQKAASVVDAVRSSGTPGFLVIRTERLGPHSKGDDLRDPAELARIAGRDPLARMGALLPPDLKAAIDERNRQFIADTLQRALEAPLATTAAPAVPVFTGPDRSSDVRPRAALPASSKTVRASLNAALLDLLGHDDVMLLGEDLHDPYGGAFKVTAGLSSRFAERVRSTPISEAGVVGSAIGLALAGYRTIVEIMFADFVTLAMDQIFNHAVKFPGMFDGVRVPLVIRTPSGGRRGYGPTHSQNPESLMCAVPGLVVVFPSHRHNAGALLQSAVLDCETPVLFFEHKLLYAVPQDAADYETLAAGAGEAGASLFPTLVRGRRSPDLTIVAYGGMLPVVEKVAAELEEEEFAVEIVAPALLQPLPRASLLGALAGRPRIAVVEESPIGPGFGSELAAALAESGYTGSVRRFAPPASPIPAARSLESAVLLTEETLRAQLLPFVTAPVLR